jgi:exopolysaccharide biosynthesis WecB/TagA/CpsF family protein
VVARVGAYTEAGLVDALGAAMAVEGTATAYGVHIGDLNHALEDPGYVDVVGSGTCLYADGNSVRLLAAIIGRRLPARLVTTDVIWPALRRAAAGGHTVFLLGGSPGMAAEAASVAEARVPGLRMVGSADGYFSPSEAPVVAERIRRSGAHLVVVAMGVPHQQRFCHQFGPDTGARLLLTAGGLYGYMTGRESRAPARVRASGFEWAWRVAQDPRRLAGRYARGCLTMGRLALTALWLRVR